MFTQAPKKEHWHFTLSRFQQITFKHSLTLLKERCKTHLTFRFCAASTKYTLQICRDMKRSFTGCTAHVDHSQLHLYAKESTDSDGTHFELFGALEWIVLLDEDWTLADGIAQSMEAFPQQDAQGILNYLHVYTEILHLINTPDM